MNMRHIPVLAFAALLAFSACKNGPQNNAAPQDGTSVAAGRQAADADSANSDGFVISFTMADINGRQVSVADEFAKHEITIIDFWASWCGPCRQEMPNLVSLYGKYKDKGLGIVGVSLDEDGGQWTEAVSSMNMTWTQLSDLQGWHNSAAQMYGIQAIPFTIIVDKNGKVLDAGLRGEELSAYVANRLGR